MAAKFIKTVACLFNGSTESAVTALLLKKKGYQVIGVQLHNRYLEASINERQQQHAMDTCKLLDIPLKEIALSDDQWDSFNKAVLEDYKKGLNPDFEVLFTRCILTGSIFHYARNQSGADAVAYPLYARTDAGYDIDRFTELKGMKLFKAVDQLTDNSFLLCRTPQKTLQRCMFPLGEFSQEVVAMIAESARLQSVPCTAAVDSALVHAALQSRVYQRSGRLVHLMSGDAVDTHDAFHEYYAGQRVHAAGHTFYVAEKNIASGDVYLVDEYDHPSCRADTFFTSLAYWIHKTPYSFYHEKQMMDCDFRTSSTPHQQVRCSITVGALNEYCGNDHIILSSTAPVRAVVPGHFCAFYSGEECIGSASILKAGPSHYAMNYKKYKKPDNPGGWRGMFQKF